MNNINGTDKDKCNYYNRTKNRLLITAYEGIPENLLLNVLGCLVSINRHVIYKYISILHKIYNVFYSCWYYFLHL